jgi:hypothetical protein
MDLNAGRRRKIKREKRAWQKFIDPERLCDFFLMCDTKRYENIRKEMAIKISVSQYGHKIKTADI